MINWLQSVAPLNGKGLKLQSVFREARTRILLLYVVCMLLLTAASIPVFRILLVSSVDNRVREDLAEEQEEFLENYEAWEQETRHSLEELKVFADDFLAETLPEDDNFHIFLIDQEFYRSNPENLLEQMSPGSQLFDRWSNISESITGEQPSDDPSVGKMLYIANPLELNGENRGAFVIAHATAGEQQEAIAGVFIFVWVAAGVVFLSFILAWVGTGQLLSPVRDLATTARTISESDLSQRIPVQGSGELAELAVTFNAMMNRIQTSFDTQRNFINDAGHELRTPITIIQGHLELMGDDPEEQHETLEIVTDELDRMGRLVNDMILLAKSEQLDFLQLETIEVGSFTEELFAKASALAKRNWQLQIDGSGEMIGDRQRLTGAIFNLITNAIQHTQDGDEIELGVIYTSKIVRFWVRDTGEGIPAVDQARIFERFARTSNRYRSSDGSGLGLAIVRAITQAHGGRVELISQLDIGSTFTLVLPNEPDPYC
ncbi:MAG: ATP-binding protein [Leptolyngbyaceae cyanobacterium MO_188.B28]|nr:ATP-binding protein [Leptolyngbyaceae cyanobacterium MO_188.B28]